MKLLKITLLGLALTSSIVAHAGSEGSESGGGGNSSGRQVADETDVREAIAVAKLSLKIALNNQKQDFSGLEAEADPSWYRNIMIGDLFTEVDELNITPSDAACTFEENLREASINGNEVCMSVPEILAHDYSKNEILAKATGLLAHEFAHKKKVAFTEDVNADKFGKEIELSVGQIEPRDYAMRVFDNLVSAKFFEIRSAYETFELSSKNGLISACASAAIYSGRVQQVHESILRLSQDLTSDGYAPAVLSPKMVTKLEDAIFRSMAAAVLACDVKSSRVHADFNSIILEKSKNARALSLLDLSYEYNIMNWAVTENTSTSQMREKYSMKRYISYVYPFDQKTCWGMMTTQIPVVAKNDLKALRAQIAIANTNLLLVEKFLNNLQEEAKKLFLRKYTF